MAFTKFASYEVSRVLDIKGSPTQQRTAAIDKLSDFKDYRTGDGYIYARIIAQSSRVNKNHDGWPSVELAGGQEAWDEITSKREAGLGPIVAAANPKHKFGYSTFIGKPIFVDHHNSDPKRARGVIVDSKLHIKDAKTAAENDEYWGSSDADPEHMPPTEIELLLEIDAKSFPKFAKAVVEGAKDSSKGIDGFSMGCDVEYSKCSHCGNKASNPDEYCSHIRMKGADLKVESGTHRGSRRKSYENCYGIGYFEISGVFDPADETALTQELIDEQPQHEAKTADAVNFAPTPEDVMQLARKIALENPGMTVAEAMPMAEQELSSRFNIAPDQVQGGDGAFTPEVKVKDTIAPPRELPIGAQGITPRYQGSYLASRKVADNPIPQEDHIKAPENVDTLREEKVCPICGSDMDSDKCDVCGYEEPPEQLQNPDLTKHQELGDDVDGLVEPGEENELIQDSEVGPDQKKPGSYLNARNTPGSPDVTSEMNNPTTSHTAAKPKGDEPSNETVTSDQTRPVTSAFRTAQELIQATRARNQEKNMADQRLAADPADPSGKAKKRVDTTGVGGVDQASAEAAGKADARVDVEGKGGVIQDSNAEASRPDEHQSLPTAGRDSDDSGFDKTKNQSDSGPTKTFDNSNEPGSAVTDKAFPTSARQAGDDAAFPKNDGGLAGGSANQGTQPADPVGKADKRVDVLDHITSPANNSGETKTWSGTDGNGVTKQQNPVTRENLEGQPQQGSNANRSKASGLVSLAALKLAETEIALGLLDEDGKYDRLAELSGQSDEEIAAEQRALSKVKTAGMRKNAATEPKGIGRVPSFSRTASRADAEAAQKTASVDDGLLDSALFG